MKHCQFLRKHTPGRPLKRRKQFKPPWTLKGGLPDAHYPSERIRRLRRANPNFLPNREGWLRFYYWQQWHGKRLSMQSKLCFWHPDD